MEFHNSYLFSLILGEFVKVIMLIAPLYIKLVNYSCSFSRFLILKKSINIRMKMK